eukprot:CAMPEP_0181320320 /NCGR_PEP_ID=MMETSP1101-20121128/18058_1 /TAXON_ID=46948 /ORGANISM="Rhodomonas abbreviata, Strain Caron Lab Isolate" /LENGTH=209 /DNA_ID=CAMNT_0023428011 /DNA_START=6 /DNA_END=635 /DNA_ORIENTATION=-
MELKAVVGLCVTSVLLAVVGLHSQTQSIAPGALQGDQKTQLLQTLFGGIDETQQTEMLKTFRVEVHPPPPVCCPAAAGVASCCGAGGGGGSGGGARQDGQVAQVNMVGFTDHGMGYLNYDNVREGQRHFDSKKVGSKKVGDRKSSTLRAQQQHRSRRMAKVQQRLKKEREEVDSLKGEVWALTSDVIPRMQKELTQLRNKLRGDSSKAK